MKSAGFDPAFYSGHSARRGGVTDAIAAGIPPSIIMRHGRWKSVAWFGYFQDDLYDKCNLTLELLAANFQPRVSFLKR